jgi:hypothetical protein
MSENEQSTARFRRRYHHPFAIFFFLPLPLVGTASFVACFPWISVSPPAFTGSFAIPPPWSNGHGTGSTARGGTQAMLIKDADQGDVLVSNSSYPVHANHNYIKIHVLVGGRSQATAKQVVALSGDWRPPSPYDEE